MARAQSLVSALLRQNYRGTTRQNPSTHFGKRGVESKEPDCNGEGIREDQNQEHPHGTNQHFIQVAKEVSRITRIKPRWEKTLLSDFPSFNFGDPQFFFEYLKQQRNVLLSLKFFDWLLLRHNFVPDQASCSLLFDSLLDAEAWGAAKWFLNKSGFSPEPGPLEHYIRCLSKGGLVEDALDVFVKLKEIGVCPSIATWNSALLGSLQIGRTDLVWKLYHDMIECGAVAEVDVKTVECLIQAFCRDGRVSEGYELLRQVLENGLIPGKVAFNKLISGFLAEKNYAMVSELLHTMIARNCAPDIYTYQEVIDGACKDGNQLEALRLFNIIKDRGYAPHRVMYLTMIHGLCEIGLFGGARKLLFEMSNKGILPNEYTYNALIRGFCKVGKFEEAWGLYKEMCHRGYRDTKLSYKIMISGLRLHGKISEAFEFKEILDCDMKAYNVLIRGLYKEGNMAEREKPFTEVMKRGLQPSTNSYSLIIPKQLSEMGKIQEEASALLNLMPKRALIFQPDHTSASFTNFMSLYNTLLKGLYEKGNIAGSKKLFAELLKHGLQPSISSYTFIVWKLCETGKIQEAKAFWNHMLKRGLVFQAHHTTASANFIMLYNALLRGLFREGHMAESKKLCAELLEHGLHPSTSSYTFIIRKLCETGKIQEAKAFWNHMLKRGLIFQAHHTTAAFTNFMNLYNALFQGLFKEGNMAESKKLFAELQERGLQPSISSYTLIIRKLCGKLYETGKIQEAKAFWNHMLKRGLIFQAHHTAASFANFLMLYDALLRGLFKEGNMAESKRLLTELLEHGLRPSISSYTLIIRKLCEAGKIQEVKAFWNHMLKMGLIFHPHRTTAAFANFLKLCNALLRGLFTEGNMAESKRLSAELVEHGLQSPTSSDIIRNLYVTGKIQEAKAFCYLMLKRGLIFQARRATASSTNLIKLSDDLIRGVYKEWNLAESQKLLAELLEHGLQPSTDSYTFIILKLRKKGKIREAEAFSSHMLKRGLIFQPHHSIA